MLLGFCELVQVPFANTLRARYRCASDASDSLGQGLMVLGFRPFAPHLFGLQDKCLRGDLRLVRIRTRTWQPFHFRRSRAELPMCHGSIRLVGPSERCSKGCNKRLRGAGNRAMGWQRYA